MIQYQRKNIEEIQNSIFRAGFKQQTRNKNEHMELEIKNKNVK